MPKGRQYIEHWHTYQPCLTRYLCTLPWRWNVALVRDWDDGILNFDSKAWFQCCKWDYDEGIGLKSSLRWYFCIFCQTCFIYPHFSSWMFVICLKVIGSHRLGKLGTEPDLWTLLDTAGFGCCGKPCLQQSSFGSSSAPYLLQRGTRPVTLGLCPEAWHLYKDKLPCSNHHISTLSNIISPWVLRICSFASLLRRCKSWHWQLPLRSWPCTSPGFGEDVEKDRWQKMTQDGTSHRHRFGYTTINSSVW